MKKMIKNLDQLALLPVPLVLPVQPVRPDQLARQVLVHQVDQLVQLRYQVNLI